MINKNETIWFVHPQYNPPLPLRFQRTNGFSAKIIGGRFNDHNTGHIETYWDKFIEIIKLGYIPITVAQESGILSDEWQPPSVELLKNDIDNGKYKYISKNPSVLF